MKVKARLSGALRRMKQTVIAVAVLGAVLVVPVSTIVDFGHFFHGSDSRDTQKLAALTVRPADDTTVPPQLFKQPLITITFDDGHQSIYKEALPLLQKYGIRTTQYVLTGTSEHQDYVSWEQITDMKKNGHEIGCHTIDHSDLTTLDEAGVDRQLRECKDELTKRYGSIPNFASPYGATDAKSMAGIRKYFSSHRNTNGDPKNGVEHHDVNLASGFDRYNIIGVTLRSDTKLSEIKALVEYARANNGWLVLTYHQADHGGSVYSVTPEEMEEHFRYLSGTDVRIVTMQDALTGSRIHGVEY